MPHSIDVNSPIPAPRAKGELRHLLLPQEFPETVGAARHVLESGDAAIDSVFDAAITRRATFPLLRHLAAAAPLGDHSLAAEVWFRNSTSRTIGFPRRRTPTGRIPLTELDRLFAEHRAIQRQVLGELATVTDGHVVILFGQGMALLHPEYAARFSHDMDLLVIEDALAETVVQALAKLGFSPELDFSSRPGGQQLRRWEFFRSYPEGNVMHVDLYLRGIADSYANQIITPARKVPPLLLGRAYERSLTADLDGARVRVPRDEDSMLLVAQKSQRHLSMTFREVGDAMAAMADPAFDWGLIGDDIESYWLGEVTGALVNAACRAGATGPAVDRAPAAAWWGRLVIPAVYAESCPARVRSGYRAAWRRQVAGARG